MDRLLFTPTKKRLIGGGRNGLKSPERRIESPERKRKRLLVDDVEDFDIGIEIDMTIVSEDDSVSEIDVSELEEGAPKKVKKETKKKSPIRESKGGRPPKSKLVKFVKSIFKQDDDLFNESRPKRQKTSPKKIEDPKPKAFIDSLIDKTNLKSIPIISGIKQSNIKIPEIEKFEPLPVPKELDQDYLDKYFDGINPYESRQGRFLEDRVFFLEGPEGYFEQHMTRAKPGFNSLTSLAPNIEYPEFNKYIKLQDELFAKQKVKLNYYHKYLYHQWYFTLTHGFNLCFNGVGSKMELITDFVENYVPLDIPTLVIDGNNPQLNFKQLVYEIASTLIEGRPPKQLSELVPYIVKNLSTESPQLLLVIHNIDGDSFRDESVQNYFTQLVSIPEIYCVCSADHINTPLLWDSSKLEKLNFIWHDLTTFKSYTHELSYKDLLNLGRSKKFIGNLGAKFVIRSLTENSRELYKLLLQQQMDVITLKSTEKTRSSFKGSIKAGVEFKTLYYLCLDQFIVSNEHTFRNLINEYIDHKMCSLVKDLQGVEYLFIPYTFDEMMIIYNQEFERKDENIED
ncbi:unnamed protein product [Candida verbasci]|uniref:Origin recognition complex subunit 2 n=1 Tax=Candida verbasci TaxID=1227364 RepID=A0A9W4TXW2_9ASCO|nr:unnamed protein product [Candida verbasci]